MKGMYYKRASDGTITEVGDINDLSQMIECHENRDIAKTELPGDVLVSTVFLWINHAFGGGEPVLFETLVFGGPLDGEMDRYHTEAEARAGHELMVERVKATAPPVRLPLEPKGETP